MNKKTEEDYKTIFDKIRGCLIAGALGDALGYAVEFDSWKRIKSQYGPQGIQELQLDPSTDNKAIISDDTQMTLFTVEGMAQGYRRAALKGIGANIEYYVYPSYLRWLETQGYKLNFDVPYNWPSRLAGIPALNELRAPGGTCLTALNSGKIGTINKPINNSKGCGGVMRTAPLGFFEKAFGSPLRNGAAVGAITHGHPLGWIPAGMLSDIVARCLYGEINNLKAIITDSLEAVCDKFKDYKETEYFRHLIENAIALSEQPGDDVAVIESIGGGWVGEEALAIAVYCVLKYSDDIKRALIAAVNHSGDSDSTGAIAGNILGAYLGMSAVPAKWAANLELADEIENEARNIMSCINGDYEKTIPDYWWGKMIPNSPKKENAVEVKTDEKSALGKEQSLSSDSNKESQTMESAPYGLKILSELKRPEKDERIDFYKFPNGQIAADIRNSKRNGVYVHISGTDSWKEDPELTSTFQWDRPYGKPCALLPNEVNQEIWDYAFNKALEEEIRVSNNDIIDILKYMQSRFSAAAIKNRLGDSLKYFNDSRFGLNKNMPEEDLDIMKYYEKDFWELHRAYSDFAQRLWVIAGRPNYLMQHELEEKLGIRYDYEHEQYSKAEDFSGVSFEQAAGLILLFMREQKASERPTALMNCENGNVERLIEHTIRLLEAENNN